MEKEEGLERRVQMCVIERDRLAVEGSQVEVVRVVDEDIFLDLRSYLSLMHRCANTRKETHFGGKPNEKALDVKHNEVVWTQHEAVARVVCRQGYAWHSGAAVLAVLFDDATYEVFLRLLDDTNSR